MNLVCQTTTVMKLRRFEGALGSGRRPKSPARNGPYRYLGQNFNISMGESISTLPLTCTLPLTFHLIFTLLLNELYPDDLAGAGGHLTLTLCHR